MRASVITISFRPGATMLRTARSVAAQDYRGLEWIVIDGGSDDGTPELLRNVPRPPDVLVSEPDRGIAHAFNKGIDRSTGDALLFLNAGDEFADTGSLSAMMAAWDRSSFGWLTAGAQVVAADGRPLYDRLPQANPADLASVACGCRIWHASTILDRGLLLQHGGYDESFRSSMDYELWVRLITRGHKAQTLQRVCARFHLGGTSGNLARRLREDRLARRMHGISRGRLGEGWLWTVNRAKIALSALRPPPWVYRCKELLRL